MIVCCPSLWLRGWKIVTVKPQCCRMLEVLNHCLGCYMYVVHGLIVLNYQWFSSHSYKFLHFLRLVRSKTSKLEVVQRLHKVAFDVAFRHSKCGLCMYTNMSLCVFFYFWRHTLWLQYLFLQENEAKLAAAAAEAAKKDTDDSKTKDSTASNEETEVSEVEKKDNSEATKEDTKETEAANEETVTANNDSEHSEAAKEDSEDSSVASTPLSSPSKSSDQSSVTLSPNNSSPQSSLTRGKAPKVASVPVMSMRGAGATLGQEPSNGGCHCGYDIKITPEG